MASIGPFIPEGTRTHEPTAGPPKGNTPKISGNGKPADFLAVSVVAYTSSHAPPAQATMSFKLVWSVCSRSFV